MSLIDKKPPCKCEEVRSDVGNVLSSLIQYKKEVKGLFDEQTSLNEVLCAENCVARWLWKSGLCTMKGNVKWDLESVNTCPENYLWQRDANGDILVEAAGLYEVTVAFFSKKKRPQVKIFINENLTINAVSKSTRCGNCG